MSEFVIEKVQSFAEELLPTMGLELVEVQFRKEGHGWVLRLFIEGEDGVNHEHCANVSREVGDYLDVEDVIHHKYFLEVSSPGLERILRNVGEFQRFHGRRARVKLREVREGQRVFVGEITSVEGDTITLRQEDGNTVDFTYGEISKARLVI